MPRTLEELRAERQRILDETAAVRGEARSSGLTDEIRTTLQARAADLDGIDAEMEQARGDADLIARFGNAERTEREVRERTRPALYESEEEAQAAETRARDQAGLTPGEIYTRSAAYADWMRRFPGGGPSTEDVRATSDAASVVAYRALLGLRSPTARLRANQVLDPRDPKMRALITQADASAGTLVNPLLMGLLEPGLVRPLTIRQLVTVIPVTTDSVEWVREVSRVNNAAPVADATALTGSSGTKPEGGLVFEKVSDTIKTIAEWVAVTRRIIKDAPQLQEYTNQYLTDDLALELEDQMISGNGSGENFLGILNDPDIQGAGPPAAGQNRLDVIRIAKRLVRVNARTNATAVVVNPEDSELIDIEKASTSGTYFGNGPYGVSDVTPLWGLARVESEAVPVGTGLVGDFRRAILFDREDTQISVGTVGDDFIRNILRILAEMRAGFAVIRPKAFCTVDFA